MRCIDFHMQVRLVPFYLLLKDRHHLQNPLNFNPVFPPPKKSVDILHQETMESKPHRNTGILQRQPMQRKIINKHEDETRADFSPKSLGHAPFE
jgi:hypothetical protein